MRRSSSRRRTNDGGVAQRATNGVWRTCSQRRLTFPRPPLPIPDVVPAVCPLGQGTATPTSRYRALCGPVSVGVGPRDVGRGMPTRTPSPSGRHSLGQGGECFAQIIVAPDYERPGLSWCRARLVLFVLHAYMWLYRSVFRRHGPHCAQRPIHHLHIIFRTLSCALSRPPPETSSDPSQASSTCCSSSSMPARRASSTKWSHTCGFVYLPAATYARAEGSLRRSDVKDCTRISWQLSKCSKSDMMTTSNIASGLFAWCAATLLYRSH